MNYLDVYTKLYNKAEELNAGWKPDWGSENCRYVGYEVWYDECGWSIESTDDVCIIGAVIFKTEELAQQALDSLTDEEKDILAGKPVRESTKYSISPNCQQLIDEFSKQYYPGIAAVAQKHLDDWLIYGQSAMAYAWDDKNQKTHITAVAQYDMYTQLEEERKKLIEEEKCQQEALAKMLGISSWIYPGKQVGKTFAQTSYIGQPNGFILSSGTQLPNGVTPQPPRTISRLSELEVGEYTKVTREEDVEDMEYHIRPSLKAIIRHDGCVFICLDEDSFTGQPTWRYSTFAKDLDDFEYVNFNPTTTTASSYHNCHSHAVEKPLFNSMQTVCNICNIPIK